MVPEVHRGVSEQLRTAAPGVRAHEVSSREDHGTLHRPPPPGAGTPAPRPTAPDAAPSAAIPLDRSFEGVRNQDNIDVLGIAPIPPDTVGDVGPHHYVQMTNVVTRIFSKTGATLLGPFANSAFWAGSGTACETQNDGDPIVLHDQMADRWLVSQFALPSFPQAPFFVCVAISTGPDPTGTYFQYALGPFSDMPDYPKFGVWPTGYFMSANMFEAGSLDYVRPQILALDRTSMLAGGPSNAHGFLLPPSSFTVLPSDLEGFTLPPPGSPNHFVELRDSVFFPPPHGLQVWNFTPDYATPPAAELVGPKVVPTGPYDITLCDFKPNCIPQPGTTQKVDAVSDRLMHRAAYRNFGSHASMAVTHTVDVGGDHAGVMWHEIRGLASAPAVHQEGVVAPDAHHRWMPSIAVDGRGSIAVGYSVSSATVHPSIRFSARNAAGAPGVMNLGETTIIAGSGSQTGGNRWGDYSAMTPDPADDSMWYTQEYYAAGDTDPPTGLAWRTRIASFTVPPPPPPSPACPGFEGDPRNQIVGTSGDDTLIGTDGPDIICGLRGDDIIRGMGGDDVLLGGAGDDVVTGGPGNDELRGGPGSDTLKGNRGHDVLRGGGGRDVLRGGAGRDELRGGAGNDVLTGGAGNDELYGGRGSDTLKGNKGNDFLNGGPGNDICRGGPGNDVIINCES